MTPPETEARNSGPSDLPQWPGFIRDYQARLSASPQPPRNSLFLAAGLFLVTLFTSVIAGTHFAAAYAHNQAASLDAFVQSFRLAYRNPATLLDGLPFAITLLTILLAHELGHYFACRHHHIRASYPFFIPAPTLIGTFGAFLLVRSAIRSRRALFDVGASGPLVGFLVALPALAYGVLNAKVIPQFSADGSADVIFGVPPIMRFVAAVLQPNANAGDLLLHPVGRAAWVGLFATSLNLLPVGQLDGGHILRCVNERLHRIISRGLPVLLLLAGFLWSGWWLWGAILLGMSFLRPTPIYDPAPLNPNRKLGAIAALLVFLLCFMFIPLSFQGN